MTEMKKIKQVPLQKQTSIKGDTARGEKTKTGKKIAKNATGRMTKKQ